MSVYMLQFNQLIDRKWFYDVNGITMDVTGNNIQTKLLHNPNAKKLY